jgi:hypothetical protein
MIYSGCMDSSVIVFIEEAVRDGVKRVYNAASLLIVKF